MQKMNLWRYAVKILARPVDSATKTDVPKRSKRIGIASLFLTIGFSDPKRRKEKLAIAKMLDASKTSPLVNVFWK
jgi:hypothetical protein